MAWVLVLALIAVGATSMGSLLSNANNPLAASSSSQLVVQDTAAQFQWGDGWRVARTRSASGGTLHATGRTGATMSLVFYGTGVELISPTGRAEGTMRVTLDGKTTIVSNHASSYHAHRVVFSASPTGSTHTLTVRVTGSPGHPYVAVDAVVISGNQSLSPDWRTRNQRIHAAPPTASPTPTPILGDPAPTPTAPDPTGNPTPVPTATPAPTATPGPTATPAPTGTPVPTPTPAPTPTPKPVAGTVIPNSIDATGATDASAKLLAFIASVPDGSTIVFSAGGTYRLNHGLVLTNRRNLVFEGNGATLKAMGSGSVVTDSPFALDDGDNGITIRDFNLVGDNPDSGSAIYHSGAENQMGIALYGAKNVEIDNVTISHTWGDCLYVAATGAGNIWSDTVWFHDSSCSQAGRDGVAIVSGSHVTIQNNHFDTLGMHVLDIEPDTSIGGGTFVNFSTNVVGIYGLGSVYTGYFFAADGAAGSTVHDVTVSGNTVAGNPHDGYDGSVRGLSTTVEVSRRGNIIFTNNSSSQAIGGPVLVFAHVDGLTISGNSEPLSRGSLTSISDSTSVHSQ
jgi:hypothetical protein